MSCARLRPEAIELVSTERALVPARMVLSVEQVSWLAGYIRPYGNKIDRIDVFVGRWGEMTGYAGSGDQPAELALSSEQVVKAVYISGDLGPFAKGPARIPRVPAWVCAIECVLVGESPDVLSYGTFTNTSGEPFQVPAAPGEHCRIEPTELAAVT